MPKLIGEGGVSGTRSSLIGVPGVYFRQTLAKADTTSRAPSIKTQDIADCQLAFEGCL